MRTVRQTRATHSTESSRRAVLTSGMHACPITVRDKATHYELAGDVPKSQIIDIHKEPVPLYMAAWHDSCGDIYCCRRLISFRCCIYRMCTSHPPELCCATSANDAASRHSSNTLCIVIYHFYRYISSHFT